MSSLELRLSSPHAAVRREAVSAVDELASAVLLRAGLTSEFEDVCERFGCLLVSWASRGSLPTQEALALVAGCFGKARAIALPSLCRALADLAVLSKRTHGTSSKPSSEDPLSAALFNRPEAFQLMVQAAVEALWADPSLATFEALRPFFRRSLQSQPSLVSSGPSRLPSDAPSVTASALLRVLSECDEGPLYCSVLDTLLHSFLASEPAGLHPLASLHCDIADALISLTPLESGAPALPRARRLILACLEKSLVAASLAAGASGASATALIPSLLATAARTLASAPALLADGPLCEIVARVAWVTAHTAPGIRAAEAAATVAHFVTQSALPMSLPRGILFSLLQLAALGSKEGSRARALAVLARLTAAAERGDDAFPEKALGGPSALDAYNGFEGSAALLASLSAVASDDWGDVERRLRAVVEACEGGGVPVDATARDPTRTRGSLLQSRALEPAPRDAALLAAPPHVLLMAVLTDLLCTAPRPTTRAAAAHALGACTAATVPSAGLPSLPVLLFSLQRTARRCAVEAHAAPWGQAVRAIVQALPHVATDTAGANAVLRSLQALVAHGEGLREPNCRRRPTLLACLGLRLVTRMWIQHRRGFSHVAAALEALGSYEHGSAGGGPPELLRVTRAFCLLEICRAQPERALKLVGALDQCLSDPAPRVQATALEAIHALCAADVLEFFSAWAVILRHMPALPAMPLAARQWVAVLACGASADASAHANQMGEMVRLLWSATGHAEPLVRLGAYDALAAFTPESLETLEILPPLGEFALLLEREATRTRIHPDALAGAERLVHWATEYAHARRRRYLGATTKAAAAADLAASKASTRPPMTPELAALRDLERRLSGQDATGRKFPGPFLSTFAARGTPPSVHPAVSAAAQFFAAYQRVVDAPTGPFSDASLGFGGIVTSHQSALLRLEMVTPFVRRWAAALRQVGGSNALTDALAGEAPELGVAVRRAFTGSRGDSAVPYMTLLELAQSRPMGEGTVLLAAAVASAAPDALLATSKVRARALTQVLHVVERLAAEPEMRPRLLALSATLLSRTARLIGPEDPSLLMPVFRTLIRLTMSPQTAAIEALADLLELRGARGTPLPSAHALVPPCHAAALVLAKRAADEGNETPFFFNAAADAFSAGEAGCEGLSWILSELPEVDLDRRVPKDNTAGRARGAVFDYLSRFSGTPELLRSELAMEVPAHLAFSTPEQIAGGLESGSLVVRQAAALAVAASINRSVADIVDGKSRPVMDVATAHPLLERLLARVEGAAGSSRPTTSQGAAASALALALPTLKKAPEPPSASSAHSSATDATRRGESSPTSSEDWPLERALRSVRQLPEEMIGRELVQVLLRAAAAPGAYGPLASSLRALAHCPRLPPADWSGALRCLLHTLAGADGTTDESHQAALAALMALLEAHAPDPKANLRPLALELLGLAAEGSAPVALAPHLWRSLGTFLSLAPATQAQQILAGFEGQLGSDQEGDAPALIAAALLEGLAGLFIARATESGAREPSAFTTELAAPVQVAVLALFARLLTSLSLPEDFEPAIFLRASAPVFDHDQPQDEPRSGWAAALACVHCMAPDALGSALLPALEGTVHALLVRAFCVWRGLLRSQELVPARQIFCGVKHLSGPVEETMPWVALAVTKIPGVERQQLLVEALDAAGSGRATFAAQWVEAMANAATFTFQLADREGDPVRRVHPAAALVLSTRSPTTAAYRWGPGRALRAMFTASRANLAGKGPGGELQDAETSILERVERLEAQRLELSRDRARS